MPIAFQQMPNQHAILYATRPIGAHVEKRLDEVIHPETWVPFMVSGSAANGGNGGIFGVLFHVACWISTGVSLGYIKHELRDQSDEVLDEYWIVNMVTCCLSFATLLGLWVRKAVWYNNKSENIAKIPTVLLTILIGGAMGSVIATALILMRITSIVHTNLLREMTILLLFSQVYIMNFFQNNLSYAQTFAASGAEKFKFTGGATNKPPA